MSDVTRAAPVPAAGLNGRGRDSDRLLAELTSSTGVGFYIRTVDPPEFLYVNDGYRKILGLAKESNPSFAAMLDRIEPEDLAGIMASGALAKAGAAQVTELRIRRPNGELRWVRISSNPVANGVSAPVRAVGTVQDVTDRKAAEGAARETEARLVEFTKNTDLGFFLRDPQEMLYMNPAFLRIFGIDSQSSTWSVPDIASMLHPDDRELAADVTERSDNGQRMSGELRLIKPGGEVRWIRVTSDPVAAVDPAASKVAGTVEDITDRKHTEILLQESEERFLQLSDNVDIGFNLYDVDPPKLLYSNPAFSRIFGFEPGGPPPGPAETLLRLHPADQPAALISRTRLFEGHSIEYDARIILPGGELRWFHANFNPIRNTAGDVVRAACFFEDITDRKLAQAAVLENDLRFRQLAGSIDVGISLRQIDPPSYLYVNSRYVDLIGFDPTGAAEGLPDLVLASIHPDDYQRVMAEYWEPSRAGKSVRSEMRMITNTGDIRWLRITSQPIRIAGESLRAAGTVEDITQWKDSEAALREIESRFQQLADNVKVGFLLGDITENPGMVYANPAFLDILGLDRALPLAESTSSMRSMIDPEDVHFTTDDLARLRAGEHIDDEFRITRADGQVRWIRYQRNPATNAAGENVRLVGITEDVTERKIAEAALRSARADAESANLAKSEFLSKMSHELRTPLNAVLGFAQLLEMDDLEENQKEFVGHIVRGGNHLLQMINDVLDISGIESDRLEVTIESVPVEELVLETVEFIRPLATERGILLTVAPMVLTAGAAVRADRRRLRQVLLNLLANSIKYNDTQGSVLVSCRLTGSGQVELSVTDTGHGISAADMPRLFMPFERLGVRQSEIEGTGIGLALSQRLVTVMAGRLSAESVFGQGSTFRVTLPAVQNGGSLSSSLPAGGQDAGLHTGMNSAVLLYIEDNLLNVKLMDRIVRRRPEWSMIQTTSGRAGIELARNAQPTLIILDLHLPDLNGIDVLTSLRADPATAAIPVVIASADAHHEQIAGLRAAGATDYITKPLDIAQVFQLLDRTHPAVAGSRPGPGDTVKE